jgi:hypothetical protein
MFALKSGIEESSRVIEKQRQALQQQRETASDTDAALVQTRSSREYQRCQQQSEMNRREDQFQAELASEREKS